jgi:uncharacterized membrane protein YkvA (DUF1232 family)
MKGNWKELGKKVLSWRGLIALVATAVVLWYFLIKIDLIPDPIPIVGYMDDVTIVIAVFFLALYLIEKVVPNKK